MRPPNSNKPRASKAPKSTTNGAQALNGAEIAADAPNGANHTPRQRERSPESAALLSADTAGSTHTTTPQNGSNALGIPHGLENRSQQDPPKERRGRRYKTFESIRRGLASVCNKVELGTLDVKQAAVAVQALNALLATVSAMKSAELERQAEQLEERAVEAALATESNGEAYGEA